MKIKNKKSQKNIVDDYLRWIEENENDVMKVYPLEYNPLFSFVVPVYNVVDEQLVECIESIRNQTYKNWELWLVDDASTWENVRKTLSKYENKDKINIHYRSENGHISRTTNDGIERVKGDFIAFMDCDDVIAPNALFEFAKKLNENSELDFIYSDEDKLSEDGKHRTSPFFKPDWSPDTFMSLMYTNHLAVYRTELVKRTGGLRPEFNGSQDYDFTLRFMELSDNKRVGHIPKVLYHWRERAESAAAGIEAKPYALEAMKKAKEEALERRGIKGKLEFIDIMNQFQPVYQADGELVSIIIPSKDNVKLLTQCVESIRNHTKYENYEIIVVDNGSSEENRQKIAELLERNNATYYYEKKVFNFSWMCNKGVEISKGKYLLFLNDDIELFYDEWLERMIAHAALPYVGAVGAKLYYPNSINIQHAGVVNLSVGPAHGLGGFPDDGAHYYGRNILNYNYLAVTAACVAVERRKYEEVGGFDESLQVAYNDVDLCFKLYEAGYYNVNRNDVTMYHHESASRGDDSVDEAKMQRLLKERHNLYSKHPALNKRDPFYNPNLAQYGSDYSVSLIKNDNNKCLGRFHWKPKYEKDFIANVDLVQDVNGKLYVAGWFFYKLACISNNAQVQIVLKDNYNKCIHFETDKEVRTDVAKAMGNNATHTGFSCKISYTNLQLVETDYKVGVMVVLPITHQRILFWTNRIIKKVSDDYYRCLVEYNVDEDEANYQYDESVNYYIDSYDSSTGLVSGWAINPNSMYNDYDIYKLCFTTGGKKYFIDTIRTVRFDIAKQHNHLPNALRAGIQAVIPVDMREGIDKDEIKIFIQRNC